MKKLIQERTVFPWEELTINIYVFSSWGFRVQTLSIVIVLSPKKEEGIYWKKNRSIIEEETGLVGKDLLTAMSDRKKWKEDLVYASPNGWIKSSQEMENYFKTWQRLSQNLYHDKFNITEEADRKCV